MNQLPILSGSANGQLAVNNSAAANEKGNTAADNQPFGEMLARQLSGKNAATDKQETLKNIGLNTMAGLKAGLQEVLDDANEVALTVSDADASPDDPGLLATLPLVLSDRPVQLATNPETGAQLSRTGRPHVQMEDAKSGPSGKNDSPKPARKERADPVLPSTAAAPTASLATDSRIAATQMAESSAVLSASTSAPTAAATALPLSGSNPATPLPQTVIDTPLTHKQWADDFGQKITWLATQNRQHAELHLNPAHLGPLDITLKLNGDQATALFSSPHAAVREAIEQSLPKLREMFADNGIMLGGATVSDQSQRKQHSEPGNPPPAGFNIRHTEAVGTAGMQHTARISQHNGMVDTFA